MIQRRDGDLSFFQFAQFERYPLLVHGVTTRTGDPQRFPSGLNLSFATTLEAREVVGARHAACTALNLALGNLVVPQQVHGRRVAMVGATERGLGAFDRASALPETDGLATADRGVALAILAADCVPLLFFDPVNLAIGAAHAGRRGTVLKIAAEMVTGLARRYGTRAEDLLVGIGPSIGPCCYAIGDEVVREVVDAFGDTKQLITRRDGQAYFDLWQANQATLLDIGVRPEHVESAALCTACHNDLFFSHRAEHGHCGRFAAIIGMREA